MEPGFMGVIGDQAPCVATVRVLGKRTCRPSSCALRLPGHPNAQDMLSRSISFCVALCIPWRLPKADSSLVNIGLIPNVSVVC